MSSGVSEKSIQHLIFIIAVSLNSRVSIIHVLFWANDFNYTEIFNSIANLLKWCHPLGLSWQNTFVDSKTNSFHRSHQRLFYSHVTPCTTPQYITTSSNGEASFDIETFKFLNSFNVFQIMLILQVEVAAFCKWFQGGSLNYYFFKLRYKTLLVRVTISKYWTQSFAVGPSCTNSWS